MGINWDPKKEQKLRAERGVELQDVADIIVAGPYVAVLENPSRLGQQIFIIWYRDYTHVVPFVIDRDENIILKTVFPSRRFHQLYGEDHEDQT